MIPPFITFIIHAPIPSKANTPVATGPLLAARIMYGKGPIECWLYVLSAGPCCSFKSMDSLSSHEKKCYNAAGDESIPSL
jgi:hypothetical protein